MFYVRRFESMWLIDMDEPSMPWSQTIFFWTYEAAVNFLPEMERLRSFLKQDFLNYKEMGNGI